MIEIIIDDVSIDLYEGTKIDLNYTNADIVELTTKGNFTYNISVPATSTNKKLFVFPELDAVEAFNSQIKKDCRIEYNGTVILNGFAIITDIVQDKGVYEYSITCYDGNSNWISNIKDSKLNDLDWSLYDHTYTKANIDASENWTLNNRFVYPLVQYGVIKDNFVVQDRTPWLNVWHVLNDIVTAQGYSISSDFLRSEFFRRLYFSPKGLPSISDDVIEANKFFVGVYESPTTLIPKGLSNDGDDRGLNNPIRCPFNMESQQGDFLYHDTDYNNFNTTSSYVYTSEITARMSFEWNYGLKSVNSSTIVSKSSKKVLLKIIKQTNGVRSTLASSQVEIPTTPKNNNVELLGTLTTDAFDIYAGDYIWCEATLLESTTSGHTIYFSAFNMNTFKNEVYSSLVKGQTVEMNRLLPDVSQLDFIADIKTMFNLYFYTNEYFKTIYIEPRDSFYNQTAEDWSDKLDISKPIAHSYLGSTLSKEMQFSYKNDSGDGFITIKERDLNDEYSWGSFRYDVGNVNASDGTGNLQTKLFCPTYTGVGLENAPSAKIPIIWKDRDHSQNYNDHDYRIMYYKGKTALPSGQKWNFEGTVRTDYPEMTMQYDSNGGNENSLFWKNTGLTKGLFYKHWHNTINTLDNSKLIKAYLKLTPRDINNLDFRKPIYLSIEGDGYYYHLQRINNYTPSEIGTIQCDLVRVISPVPQVELTEIIPSTNNDTPPIIDAQTEVLDYDIVIDLPTRIIIDGVEQTIDVEYKILHTYKAIVGTSEQYVTIK